MFIKVDTSKAQEKLIKSFQELSQKKVNLSVTRAINSSLLKTQTQSARYITGRYNLTYGQVATKLFVVKASPKSYESMMRGYLKSYNQPFSLAAFNPKEINEGMATLTKRGRISGGRKAIGLRANKKLIKSGVIVEVIKGQQKVLPSAYIALRAKRAGDFTVSGRGRYNRGFQFNTAENPSMLRGVSATGALRSSHISSLLQRYVQEQYMIILFRELEKRVKGVGEQHSKYV